MKSITDALAAHLAGDTMTTARLWKIKRKATTQVSPVQAYLSGPSYSDPSCDQAQIGSDWEFVTGEWRTVSTLVAPSETGWLYAYGFGFNIPSTATIIGIVCQATYSADSVTAGDIQEVSLFNSGAAVGTEKTPNLQFTASQQTMSQGGQTDLWGYALTPAIVNSSNFGFGIRAYYDGVRLYATQFAMTVYYTLPASGVSGASRLTLASTLAKHTNWTAGLEADTTSDSLLNAAGGIAWDAADDTVYTNATNGQVQHWDGASGESLGIVGTFGTPGRAPNYSPLHTGGGMRILNHPTRGKWLIISDSPVWGMNLQAMALDAKTAAGAPITPGTVTNVLNTMWANTGSSGNTGNWDVDPAGYIWVFGVDNGGTWSGMPRLQQIGFTGDTTLGFIVAQPGTDFNSLYSWTAAYGVRYDPVSAQLALFGGNASGNIVARVDQNNAFTITVSSTSIPITVPLNVGADGAYVIVTSVSTFEKIRLSDLTVVQSQSYSDYGIGSGTLNYCWYDSVNNYAWARFVSSAVAIFDLSNATSSGLAQLSDSTDSASFGGQSNVVSYQALAVSPDGSYGVTEVSNSGTPAVSFIDFWGAALQSAGIPLLLNSVVMGFTDHDLDILYDDGSGDGPVLYIARTGATWSAIESKPDMAVDNLDIDSFLESDAITEGDIRGGLYDGAECTIYLVNWADLTQKHLTLRYGVFGKVKIVNGLFTTEIRGLAYALGFTIGDYYGTLCRAELFSTPQNAPNRQWYCNLNAALFQQNGSVASSADAYHIVPAAGLIAKGGNGGGGAAPAGWFDFGLLVFTGGQNQNLKYEVESWDGTTLTLEFPLAYPAAAGDTFMILPGCDKLLTTCINKFNNAVNHRGEAWIPGLDAVLDMFPSA